MTYLIFIGDMLVSAFMIAIVLWLFWRADDKRVAEAAQIPLEDERDA